MTYRLKLLGSVRLEGPDGVVRGRATHRRRLGVMALLAVPPGRSQTRERVIDFLWPEASSEGGRRLLTESLYVIRQAGDLVLSAGEDLRLNPDLVTSDVAELECAMERGDFRAVVRLYEGPLLDGWYVEDAPDFERWAEGERARIAALQSRALEALASESEEEGDWVAAAEWRRVLWSGDPYNSRFTAGLMRAHALGGDPAAAHRVGEAHVALIREERGVQPTAEVSSLMERLRTEPFPQPPRAEPPVGESSPVTAEPSRAESPAVATESETPPEQETAPAPEVLAQAPASPAPPRSKEDAVTGGEIAQPPSTREPKRLATRGFVLFSVLPPSVAASMLVVLAIGSILLFQRYREPKLDIGTVAVLYFDDLSAGRDRGYFASSVTEALIHRLGKVPGLRVISANGVRPYRDATLPLDSIARLLGAGMVAGGSVQHTGGRVRVSVELADARTGEQIGSWTVEKPDTAIFTLQESVADEVVTSIRLAIGSRVHLHARRAGTKVDAAYELALSAEELRHDAAASRAGRHPSDVRSSLALLARADSLLEVAERRDPRWSQLAIDRGRLALDRAGLVEGSERDAALAAARAHAQRVLTRSPGDAQAREIRGTANWRAVSGSVDSKADSARVRVAEAELRGAVAADPSLSSAWIALGQLLMFTGRTGEAGVAIERAVKTDTYLASADDALFMFFHNSLLGGEYAAASAACEQGARAFPSSARYVECRLTLMREDQKATPDTAAAWAIVARLERIDPREFARAAGNAYGPIYRRMVAASISARAGDVQRARAELARAHRDVQSQPELRVDLAYDEAYLRLVLGERAAADSLLRYYAAAKPGIAPFLARDPLFTGIGGRTPVD
ncbi:MAG TPA: BTAD domain-containing putative transcriptional regulator [Longimicrobium sp.]|nr:BTAD domain-containing putative transcriptional regulator [Longimicrobium sp.]